VNCDTQTIVIQTTPDQLFDFLAMPENLPKWAVRFCHSIRPMDKGWWVVKGCMGEIPVRYASDRRSRIIDYHVRTPGGEAVIPTRVVPAGARAAYIFTQFQPEGMPDGAFQEQVDSLKDELKVLKSLVEKDR